MWTKEFAWIATPSVGKSQAMPTSKNTIFLAGFILFVIFVVSLIPRIDRIQNGPLDPYWHSGAERFWNYEVTANVTDSLLGYQYVFDLKLPRTYLPIISPDENDINQGWEIREILGEDLNDPALSWRPFRYDRYGYTAYVSFPPGFFLTTYAILKALSLPIEPVVLRWFNIVLQALTVVLLAVLTWLVLEDLRRTRNAAATGLVVAGTCYIFALEPFHSHVASIWAHQFIQPLWLAAVIIVFWVKHSWFKLLVVFVIAMVTPLIEWTAYLMLLGLFVAMIVLAVCCRSERNDWIANCIVMTMGVLIAMTIKFLWYDWAIGIDTYIEVLTIRAGERSIAVDSYDLSDLFRSYMWSYGPWIIATLLLGSLSLLINRPSESALPLRVWLVFGALVFPVLENIPLLEHAIVYSFAKLKFGLPLSLILGVVVSSLWNLRYGKITSVALVVSAVAISLWTYNYIHTEQIS